MDRSGLRRVERNETESCNVASPREELTQVIFQHRTSLTLRAALPVLIKNSAVPLVVDRDFLGSTGCDLPRLRTEIRDCRLGRPTRSRRIATLKKA